MGRAYLWSLPEQERNRLMERIADCGRESTAGSLQRTTAAFKTLARDGYCMVSGEYHRDSYGIAVPIRLGSPERPMSLSCAAMLPARSEVEIREVIVPALKDTAQCLSEALCAVDSELF